MMAASFDGRREGKVDMAIKIEDCTELERKSLNQSATGLEHCPQQEFTVPFRTQNRGIDELHAGAAESS